MAVYLLLSVAVAALNEDIYIMGGVLNPDTSTAEVTSSVARYDVIKKEWTPKTVSHMRRKRRWHGAVVMNNKIYVVGGGDGSNSKDFILY